MIVSSNSICIIYTYILYIYNSVKAVKENIAALKPLLPRIIELLVSGECHVVANSKKRVIFVLGGKV